MMKSMAGRDPKKPQGKSTDAQRALRRALKKVERDEQTNPRAIALEKPERYKE